MTPPPAPHPMTTTSTGGSLFEGLITGPLLSPGLPLAQVWVSRRHGWPIVAQPVPADAAGIEGSLDVPDQLGEQLHERTPPLLIEGDRFPRDLAGKRCRLEPVGLE